MLATPEQFAARKYDYVVVGGGTAGLVVAARYVSCAGAAPPRSD